MKKVFIGSDESTPTTTTAIAFLKKKGFSVICCGALSEEKNKINTLWTSAARDVAKAVQRGDAWFGVLFCFTGTGVSIAANKFHSVRAALCQDSETATGARRWNDANILVMSLRLTTDSMVKEIIEAWISSAPDKEDTSTKACLADLVTIEQNQS